MRFLLGFALLLFTASAHASSPFWQDMDACKQEGAGIERECIEKQSLKRNSNVKREPLANIINHEGDGGKVWSTYETSRLTIKTKKKDVTFVNIDCDCDAKADYVYYGLMAPYGYHVVGGSYYEGRDIMLVQEDTGEQIRLNEFSASMLSPDGARIVDTDWGSPVGAGIFKVYRFDERKGFVLEKESFAPCFEDIKEGESFFAFDYKWKDAKTLFLTGVLEHLKTGKRNVACTLNLR